MNIHVVSDGDVQAWVDSLGKTFTPGSEEEFAAFEKKYLTAYAVIFEEFSKVASMDEDAALDDAHLSMSSWVDPTRDIDVVITKKGAFTPELLQASNSALKRLDEKFAIVLRKYPTYVYVFPDDNVLINKDSNEDDLVALGLR